MERKVHKSREVKDILEIIDKWLDSIKFDREKYGYKVCFRNQYLKRDLTVEEAEIKDGSELYVMVEDKKIDSDRIEEPEP